SVSLSPRRGPRPARAAPAPRGRAGGERARAEPVPGPADGAAGGPPPRGRPGGPGGGGRNGGGGGGSSARGGLPPARPLEGGGAARLLVAEQDGELRFLLPVSGASGLRWAPIAGLRPFMHDYCFLGTPPLAADGDPDRVWAAVLGHLRRHSPV